MTPDALQRLDEFLAAAKAGDADELRALVHSAADSMPDDDLIYIAEQFAEGMRAAAKRREASN